MSKAVKKYLRQVRSWLPCAGKAKKMILTDIENIISSGLKENPNLDLQGLHARFGTPQQIAAAHVDEMETPELLRQLRIRRRIVTIILIVAVLALTVWLGIALIALVDAHQSNDSYFTVTIYNRFIGGFR